MHNSLLLTILILILKLLKKFQMTIDIDIIYFKPATMTDDGEKTLQLFLCRWSSYCRREFSSQRGHTAEKDIIETIL